MYRSFIFIIFFLLLTSCSEKAIHRKHLPGLAEEVEVVRDSFGINHIYASNQHDLFFAQGYLAARDRLFQFEIWRRQATGSVAEILGERELKRDIGTRLFKYRGDLQAELNHYHDDGVEIISAYTDGVNAYIEESLADPQSLPFEFEALGILPQKWTPEVVISRHQGLLGNIEDELDIGRAVALIGEDKVRELLWFHPKRPNLSLEEGITAEALSEDILELYNAFRKPVKFIPEDIVETYRATEARKSLVLQENDLWDPFAIGSNNWVVDAGMMGGGTPLMANDPHRTLALPSLRYMAHLVAPGWDVIGGGEPEIPGISIGHNPHGAWGLTVFRTDGEDLMVYETHPENPNQYRYEGQWKDFETIRERIPVKGMTAAEVELKYSVHGPVVFEDTIRSKAYAVRCAWLEPGGSPYLASLRMDQATTWEAFREACNYSNIPGENMIWADTAGTIGWQAVGIAPIRQNFSGLVPVPGDGRFEWNGYLPIIEKPSSVNPEQGYIATANQNVTPEAYGRWDAIGFSWSDSFRGRRIEEVLEQEAPFNLDDMMALQTDYFSVAARELIPYLQQLSLSGTALAIRKRMEGWDYVLDAKSVSAAIYVAWENQIRRQAHQQYVPDQAKAFIPSLQLERILQWLRQPEAVFGSTERRDAFLAEAFETAIHRLTERLGDDPEHWQYGQTGLKHTLLQHPLSASLGPEFQDKLELGPYPRGGNGYTPGSTGNNFRQSSGASFRVIIPVGDWDQAVGTNSPGQSGDPESPFFGNLFESWAKDEYFPLWYSRDSVLKNAYSQTLLSPQ